VIITPGATGPQKMEKAENGKKAEIENMFAA